MRFWLVLGLSFTLCSHSAVGQSSTDSESAADTLSAASEPAGADKPTGASEPTVIDEPAVRVTVRDSEGERQLQGRVVVKAQDGGLLLEEPNGRLQIIPSGQVMSQESSGEAFEYLSPDGMSEYLLSVTGAEFQIHQTEHYVLCSAANDEYTEFCGKLLELVYQEFYEEFGRMKSLELHEPRTLLPVIIFATSQDFSTYAKRQHPEVDFADTPVITRSGTTRVCCWT